MRSLESALLGFACWTVLYALLLGGVPWRFPQGGEIWLRAALLREAPR